MSASSPQVRGIIVFVKKQKRKNGRVYLSVVQGYRGEDGKTKTRHVRSLGYLDELEKAYDDPVAHFRAEVEAENDVFRQVFVDSFFILISTLSAFLLTAAYPLLRLRSFPASAHAPFSCLLR